jgi:hypothetical protein
MNKLFYCNESGQMHYVYAKHHLSAAHKFKERFKQLFGKWSFNPNDVREVKKTFPMDPLIVEERKAEVAKQINEYSHGVKING